MTAALPGVVGGFSLLVFTTNWLPRVRLTGPLLNLTEMGSKGTSTECIKQKSIRKAKHSRGACFLVRMLLIRPHLLSCLLLFSGPLFPSIFHCSSSSSLPPQHPSCFFLSTFPLLSTQSGYCESWSFQCGWNWPFGYLLAKKSERGLQSSPTVATLSSASLVLASLGAPEPGRLPAMTEKAWLLLPSGLLTAPVSLTL